MTEPDKKTPFSGAADKALLEMLIEYAPAGIAMLDTEMRYLAVSKRFLRDYRVTTPDVIGKSHYEIFPDLPERWKEVHRRCLAGAIEKNDGDEFPRADGTIDYLKWEVRPWHQPDGQIGGVMLFAEIITERKMAEEALMKGEEKYRSLFNSIDQGFCIHEVIFDENKKPKDLRFLEVNSAFERQSTLTHVLGRTTREILPELEEFWYETYGQIVLTGEPKRFQNYSSEVHRWYDVYAWRIGPPQDRQVAVLFNDITQLKASMKALEDAKKVAESANYQKSSFLANMSHEIRTPLGVILGFSELLADPKISPSTRSNFIATIKRNGELLAKVIDDVLDLSKVESGNITIEIVEVPIQQLFSDIRQSLQLLADKKGISLQFFADGSVPDVVSTDPLRVRQILLNIFGNALKFTEKGSVNVTLGYSSNIDGESELTFTVTDTGIGIAKENVQKLFKPFTQEDASTARKFGGTGLGLILSKKLANLLGGDIRLVRTQLGKGSTFEIKIKAGPAQKVAEPSSHQAHTLPSHTLKLSGVKVLVVDDSTDNQFLTSRLLELAGASVDLASDGQEALENVSKQNYTVILMDLQMPVMDGYEATAKLRQMGCKTPIVALTAHAMVEEKRRLLKSGFNEHVTKPINIDLLTDSILRVIS